MSKWIKKDDKVRILTGNDKGRIATVISRKGERVVLQGINIRKKHMKRRTKAGAAPSIIEMEMPLHVSNLCLCKEDGTPIKLQVRTGKGGKKELFYLDGEKEVVHRQIHKPTKSKKGQ